MMPEVEEAPAVGVREPLAVLDGYVEAVELAGEIPPAGRFRPRAVRKRWIKNACQFFDDDGSFGEGTGLEAHVQVFLFDIDMVVFGEARLAVVEAIRRQWRADKDPVTITYW